MNTGQRVKCRLALLCTAVLCGTLVACASSQTKPVKVSGDIQAQRSINLDVDGIAQPVIVRLFFLNDDEPFHNASFKELLQGDPNQLFAGALVHFERMQVLPGQRLKLDSRIARGSQFVGVAAAFRQLNSTDWKMIKTLPQPCWLCFGAGLWHSIHIDLDQYQVQIEFDKN